MQSTDSPSPINPVDQQMFFALTGRVPQLDPISPKKPSFLQQTRRTCTNWLLSTRHVPNRVRESGFDLLNRITRASVR